MDGLKSDENKKKKNIEIIIKIIMENIEYFSENNFIFENVWSNQILVHTSVNVCAAHCVCILTLLHLINFISYIAHMFFMALS